MQRGRSTFAEFVAAVSGATLIVALFFDWYGLEVGPVETSASGWESLSFVDVIVALVGAVAVIHWVARGSGWLDRPLPVAPAAVLAAAGVIALLLVVLRIVDVPDAADAADLDGRRVGTFLALFAAAGIVLGAVGTLKARVVRDRDRAPGEP